MKKKHTCGITNDCDGEQCECEVGYDEADYFRCIHCCGCPAEGESLEN